MINEVIFLQYIALIDETAAKININLSIGALFRIFLYLVRDKSGIGVA